MPESSFPSRLAFRGAQVFVVLVATMATDSALASPGWSGDVSLGIVGFHYKEFADDDSVLDREDGNIPGVATTLRYDDSTWGIVSSTSFYSGDAAYDGQTQLGIPITTTTKEQMFGFTLHAYRHVAFGGPRGSELYSGLGYQWWGRDISPTRTSRGTTVSGLYEEYRWWTAFLGGQLSLTSDSTSRWDIDARILRTINPTVEVDFAGSTDNVELPLGEAWGFFASAPWKYTWNRRTHLRVEPYVSIWRFGRSSSEPLKQGGAVVGSVQEPRSETRIYGITLGVGYAF